MADLRDAQGLALIVRLTEIEECASVHTLREFMTKILRLESMVCGEQGGTVGAAIRACNRRLDNHRATMDDFHDRIRIQDWYPYLSEQEDDEEARQSTTRAEDRDANNENQSGVENRPPGRRRIRGQAPQRRFQRTMPRPPPPPAQGSSEATTLSPEMIQQGMQRLFVAYNQCVTRVAETDDRLEQFRSTIRRDALELTLNVQRNSQDLQRHGQSVERIKHTLFDEVQRKVTHLNERLRMVVDHIEGITKTIDKNTHSKCASITALTSEQEDIRRLVEELAKRLDQPQEASGAVPCEFSAAVQLEISDLKAKVLRLTEQSTEKGGKANMSERVDLMEQQIIKWRYRLPDLTDDNSKERVVTAVEVREDLYEFKDIAMRKIRELATTLAALEGEVRLFERDREESWEAVSHKVSTLVDDSVSALTERLSELEHTV